MDDSDSLVPPLPKGPAPSNEVNDKPDSSSVSEDKSQIRKSQDDGVADDGWQAVWEPNIGEYYFYNALTRETSWINPRAQGQQDTNDSNNVNESKEKSIEDQVYEEEQERLSKLQQEQQQEIQKKRLKDDEQGDEEEEEENVTPEYIQATIPQHEQPEKRPQRLNRKQIQQFKRIKKERKTKLQRQWLLD